MRGIKVEIKDDKSTIPWKMQVNKARLTFLNRSSEGNMKSAIEGNFIQGMARRLDHTKRFKVREQQSA